MSLLSYVPITFTVTVIVFLYTVYMLTLIGELVKKIYVPTLVWVVVTNVFFLMTFFCFLLVVCTDPGTVPSHSPWNPYGSTSKTAGSFPPAPHGVERKRDGRPRFCRICGKYKPDRTHHSRKMGRCVLEMDHYCPWVNNCIGHFNKKYFLLFIFYSCITLLLYCIGAGKAFVRACQHAVHVVDYLLVFTWIFAALLGAVMSAFMVFHLWLLTNAYTTIEYCEKRLAPEKVKGTGDFSVNKLYATSPYNVGWYKNWKAVLGPNPVLWLIPTRYGLDMSPNAGCAYEVHSHHQLSKRSISSPQLGPGFGDAESDDFLLDEKYLTVE
mmetsp:Transcript_32888/g.40398  ORF Transcript_32888/g.40398 Transcript_32888/m.40398 type:complete len:324 (-) Transcript_32888:256-1227(-)